MPHKMLQCSEETLAGLHKLVPGLTTAPDDEKLSRLHQHLLTKASMDDADAGSPADIQAMSREQITEKADAVRRERKRLVDEELPRLREQLNQREARVTELSRMVPEPITGAPLKALTSGIRTKAEACVARGAISPVVKDRLYAKLVEEAGKPNVLALSSAANGGNDPLALAVFDVLMDNRPVQLGEASGLQALARDVPGAPRVQSPRDVVKEKLETTHGSTVL